MVNLMTIICVTLIEALSNYSECLQNHVAYHLYRMSVLPAFDVYKEKFEDTREETRRRRSKQVVFDFAMYQIKFVGYLRQ